MTNKLLFAAPLLGLALAAQPAAAQNLLKQLGQQAAQAAVNAAAAKAGLNGATAYAATGVNPFSQGVGSTVAVNTTDPAVFQRYGDWEFKLNELRRGVDDQWQAVIGVRNVAAHRQGIVASEIKVFVLNEDGEGVPNWGEIYKAGVEGTSMGLETVNGTLWLEPGDQTRIRLRFDGTRKFDPVKIRIQSTGATAQVRTFALK